MTDVNVAPQQGFSSLAWRSLGMLRAMRGHAAMMVVLGLVVSALPYVANAAFGPVMQAVADAGAEGKLSQVWGVEGALLSRSDDGGPLAALATPLPFAVLLLIWAGALVAAQLLSFANSWVKAQVEWKLLTELRQRVHDHLQSLSLDFFTGARSGALMQRVTMEAAGVQRLLTDCLIPPLVDAVVLVIALGYLLALSWQMTLVALVLTPFALVSLRFAGQRVQAAMQKVMTSHRKMGGELEETVTGISEIQVFNAEAVRSRRFHDSSESAAKSTATMVVWIQATANGAQVFIALSTVLVLVCGVAFSGAFGLTFAGLVVFVGFVPTMFAAVQRIITAYTTYKSIVPNVVSTYELLDTRPTIHDRADAVGEAAVGELHGNLVFDDVAFSYSPEQQILDGLSFSIAEGETVALVGGIGSGKSTVFNLLLRFLEPQRGRITLDGHDLAGLKLVTLREHVSKLAQFPFFTKDSIRENVRMARPTASDADVERACRDAHVHGVITDRSKLRDGYDTVVDVQVPSGGQKRLIALARCLLRSPEVLLLDEPTENLDADQRARLTGVIREYARDRTCVVISHDMDFIAAVADRILVLDHGRIVQQGDHAELMTVDGLYKRLYEAQNVDPGLVYPSAHV